MYICKNCGQTYADPVRFCGKCGSNLIEAQGYTPQPEYNPYNNQPQGYSYVTPPAPTSANNNKVMPILSMSLGIFAAVFAFYVLMFATSSRMGFGSFFFASMFTIPPAIVGLVMSFKSGAVLQGMSLAGKITSFAALGMSMFSFVISIS